MAHSLILLAGIGCAAIGGELFVRGVVGVAVLARVSAGIIAATFAAFATSSPELSVSVTSALAGAPQIALGDALDSNVVNLALILGLALLISPIRATRDGQGFLIQGVPDLICHNGLGMRDHARGHYCWRCV